MGDVSNAGSAGLAAASTSIPVFPGNAGDQLAVDHILFIRAAERMRIANELHDNACQLLALIQLNLGRMRRQAPDQLEVTIAECEEMISRIGVHLREVCSTSSP